MTELFPGLMYKSNQQPIGIFDSGVGGLSIAKEISRQLPHEHLLYVADSLHAPYGNKSVLCIEQRVNTIARQLITQNIKALVIACNTATVNAIEQLRQQISIPVIGVEPAIKPAANYSRQKKVGILVTQSTANNPRFLALVERFSSGVTVFIQPCPGLVELIEQGQHLSEQCHLLLASYLAPLQAQQVDTLVLGCTHYPFVKTVIETIVGDQMHIMETAKPVTAELTRQLHRHNIAASDRQNGQSRFFSTQYSIEQQQLFSSLWQSNILLENF